MSETWYAVNWNEVNLDTEGKIKKRYHQYNFWTRAAAERLITALRLRQAEGTVDNIRLEPLHFENPPPGMPKREN